MGQITELIENAHDTAREKGWWNKEQDFGTLIALCHSELSEDLEEYRNGRSYCEADRQQDEDGEIKALKGIPDELADTVIRIFDMCGHYGIDLESAILEKMEFNKSRPHKHGGKVI